MKQRIPLLLTTFRLLLGPLALTCAWYGFPRIVYLPILLSGTLSDIFDGVLARRLGVSTPRLRRYDSTTDAIYYLFLLAVLWIVAKPVLISTRCAIVAVALSEIACVAVSFIRFGKYPATHTVLAKIYGLSMLAGLVGLLVLKESGWLVIAVACIALITNIEIVAIHLLAKVPPVDVKSIFHVPQRVEG